MKLSPRVASWAAGGLLAIHALLCWLARGPGIETGRDDAKYLLLGRALRHFSYREIWSPEQRIHGQYPPGFPAGLALWGGVIGEQFDRLILFNVGASVLALFVTWRVARRGWGEVFALAVLLALVPNPYLVGRAGLLMSEALFMALSVAAISVLYPPNPSAGRLAGGGALAVAASLTRSAGVAILPAVGIYLLVQRRWKAFAAFFVVSALTTGSWLVWTVLGPPKLAGDSYVGDALGARTVSASEGARLGVLISHIGSYLTTSVPLVMPMPTIAGTPLDNLVGATITIGGLIVGLLVLWKRWPAAALHLTFAFALLFAWPWTETRLFGPLIPVLVVAVFAGIAAVVAYGRPAWSDGVVAILALVLAASGMLRTQDTLSRRANCRRGSAPPDATCATVHQDSYYSALRYIRDHVPDSAVIVSAKPEPLYYYTGRRAVIGRTILNADSANPMPGVRAAGAEWILLSSLQVYEPRRMHARLRTACTQLSLEASFPPTAYLFKVRDAAAADSSACRALDAYRLANTHRVFATDPP